MSPGRSILLVARGAPPSPLPGARRIEGLSRYLEQLGHEVTVLAAPTFGRGGGAWGPTRVVRARDVMASPLLERRRSRRAAKAAASTAAALQRGAENVSTTAGGGAGELRRGPLDPLVPPDSAALTWIPFALPRALALAREHRFDCVITSAPPPSTHLIGLALHARGLPWVVDVRDGWNFEQPDRVPLIAPSAWIDRRLERLVMTRADAVTTVTPRLTADLVDRFGARAVTVTNGFDPAERVEPGDGAADDLLSADRFSLVYTGSLYPTRFRPFARALAAVLRDRPALRDEVEVVIVGSRWQGIAKVAEDEGVDIVRWVPALPREDVLRLQRRADALLVLLEPQRPGLVTTKLFEYMAADRPILVVGPEADAAEILADAGGGFTVPPTTEAVASGLERLLKREPPPAGRSGRNPYTYPRIAARMAEQVELAIARHRG